MLRIRFFRTGKKHQPSYRIVVTDKKNPPRGGRFVDEVGFWNPVTKEKKVDGEKIKYWISKGAQASDSVYNLLVSEGVVEGKKIPVHSKKTGKKAQAKREKEKEEAKEEAAKGEEVKSGQGDSTSSEEKSEPEPEEGGENKESEPENLEAGKGDEKKGDGESEGKENSLGQKKDSQGEEKAKEEITIDKAL